MLPYKSFALLLGTYLVTVFCPKALLFRKIIVILHQEKETNKKVR